MATTVLEAEFYHVGGRASIEKAHLHIYAKSAAPSCPSPAARHAGPGTRTSLRLGPGVRFRSSAAR